MHGTVVFALCKRYLCILVRKDTISHWVKASLRIAGIDTSMFKPHSTRAAATSAAQLKGISLTEIINVAGWSSATTFARFYDKTLQSESNRGYTEKRLY